MCMSPKNGALNGSFEKAIELMNSNDISRQKNVYDKPAETASGVGFINKETITTDSLGDQSINDQFKIIKPKTNKKPTTEDQVSEMFSIRLKIPTQL